MTARVSDLVRTAFSGNTSREILAKPVDALLGVTTAAKQALSEIGIETVFDLATSITFHNALALMQAAKGDTSGFGRAGAVPGDLVDNPFRNMQPSDLLSEKVSAFRTIGPTTATAVEQGLSIENIRELALWAPFEAARAILSDAFGVSPKESSDPEMPADLVPGTGRYPTERVQYEVLVLDTLSETAPPPKTHRGPKPLPGANVALEKLEDAGQIDLGKLDTQGIGFDRPALGALLTYTQSWFPEGLALGQLLHTIALAPGESTRIAMIDWTRRSRARTSEGISETEMLVSDLERGRSISEIVNAVATEAQQGFSESFGTGASFGTGTASGGAGSADLSSVVGLPLKVAGGSGESMGFGVGASYGKSSAWTTGQRNLSANMAQNILDRTHQASNSARNRWATVVREVSQSESERVSTRSITNYNHMHALSIEYFEVVQLCRVAVELAKVTACLFIPMKLLDFEKMDIVSRYKRVIAAVGLIPRVRLLAQSEPDTISISAPNRTGNWVPGGVTWVQSMFGEPVGEPTSSSLAFPLNWYPMFLSWDEDAEVSALILEYSNGQKNELPVSTTTNQALGKYSVVFAQFGQTIDKAMPFWDVVSMRFKKKTGKENWAGPMNLRFMIGSLQRDGFPKSQNGMTSSNLQFAVDIEADDKEPIVFEMARTVSGRELRQHLMDNRLYYSQAIWRSLDAATIAQLLSGYSFQGKPVLLSVDPLPVTIAGNFLVFRRHQQRGEETAWNAWLQDRDIFLGNVSEDLVPLPSGGVFAEAVLGRFNSAEKLDITRFWNWQDSPIPITAPDIAAIQMGSRAQAENLMPGQLSQPVLNIQAAPDAPDPQGLTAILQAIQNGNMFRDMSGLNATIGFAQTALTRAFDAARDAASQAGENMKTAADIYKSAFGGQGSTMPGGQGGAGKATAPGSSGKNASETGALINHGQDMDRRGLQSSGGQSPQGIDPGIFTSPGNGATGANTYASTSNEGTAFNAGVGTGFTPPGGGFIQNVSTDGGTVTAPSSTSGTVDLLVGDPNGRLDLASAVDEHAATRSAPATGTCVQASAENVTRALSKIGVMSTRVPTTDGSSLFMPLVGTSNGNVLSERDMATLWFSNAKADNWMRLPKACRGAGAPGALLYADLVENRALLFGENAWPQGMKPGALMQLWSSRAEYEELRDNGVVPFKGHSCVFHAYDADPTKIYVSDQSGVRYLHGFPLFGLPFVIAANWSKGKFISSI